MNTVNNFSKNMTEARNGGGTPPLFPPLGGVVVFIKMNIGI